MKVIDSIVNYLCKYKYLFSAYLHENAMVRALVSMWTKRKIILKFIQHGNGKCKNKNISSQLTETIKIPVWAREMNFRIMSLSLIKKYRDL